MPHAATNQTISYLGRRFAAAGIRLNSRHGQNFLKFNRKIEYDQFIAA